MLFNNIIPTELNIFSETTGLKADSLLVSSHGFPAAQIVKDSIQGTFLQPSYSGSSAVEILPMVKSSSPNDWMLVITLILLVFTAALWFAMPGGKGLFQQMKQVFKRQDETTTYVGGYLFPAFFYLNYFIVIVLIALLVIEQFFPSLVLSEPQLQLLVLVSLVFAAYNFYKLSFIVLAGFLFKTADLAARQIRLYINVNIFSGFLFLPLLVLLLITQNGYLIYFGFFIILIANLIKWLQTIAIGKMISRFKLYHLIIYLCTLEIVPVLLLLKLIGKHFS